MTFGFAKCFVIFKIESYILHTHITMTIVKRFTPMIAIKERD